MPSQHYFGGMAANQTTFDGQQFRNQVAYAFKNCSTYAPPFQQMSPQMPTQFQQQMGMGSGYMYPPQMYGGMAQMGMMNMDASNFYTDEKKAKKIKAKKKSQLLILICLMNRILIIVVMRSNVIM